MHEPRQGRPKPGARGLRAAVLALVLLVAPPGVPIAAEGALCRLALVLALDISSSVDAREYELQREGLVRALRRPAIADAILSPEGTGIALTVFEWSGYAQQDVVVPWTMLDSREAIAAVAARLERHRRPFSDLATALGKAVEYGAQLFARAPPCGRRVIDVSGDGENNDGVGPEYFRARGLLDGITVNGLAIDGAQPSPVPYYRTHVLNGPGAFLLVADDYDDYPRLIAEKLLREIEQEMIVGSVP